MKHSLDSPTGRKGGIPTTLPRNHFRGVRERIMGRVWKSSLVGQKFNRLLVIARVEPGSKDKQRKWVCLCECGNETVVASRELKNGETKSCGCYKREESANRKRTHGRSKSPVYIAWKSMKRRCNSPQDPQFKDYGGRGIKVCPEWESSFEQFFADMGEPPEGTSIDRKDNDGGYYPENCRWATLTEQANNKQATRYIQFRGETMSMAELARKTGAHYEKARHRIVNLGWTVEEAIIYAGGTI